MTDNLYFVLEGDVSFCIIDDVHKARTTVMGCSQLGTFGDYGRIIADVEAVAVKNAIMRDVQVEKGNERQLSGRSAGVKKLTSAKRVSR